MSRQPAGSPPLQPRSETRLDGWGQVGAPEGLQLPLSLELGGGPCHQGEPSWDVGEGEEQRAEKEASLTEEKRRGRGLTETYLDSHLSPRSKKMQTMGPEASR